MASFDFCIDQAFKGGRITKDVAERLKQSDDVDAELTNIVANLNRQKRETVIQTVRLSEAWKKASQHEKGAYEGLLSMLSKDRTGKAGYENVEYLQKYYQGQYHSEVADMLQHLRTRALGFYQNEEDLHKLIRAIYGEEVGDPQLMKFAQDWHKLSERMRQDFNARGGSIGKNERYLMPQHHDAKAVEKIGLEEWKKRILPKLDRTQMLDDTGKPLSDKQISEALDYTYESITTHGLNKTTDLTVPRLGKKLSRKGSDRRFLYFKDASSWMEYQKDFGRGDVFSTLTDHIDMMSHDIALMELFGPNPETTFKGLLSQVEKSQGQLKGRKKWFLDAVYNNISGKTNQGELTGLADFMQTTRNVITASTLGRAFLSAFSDVGFQAVTAKYNSVPAFKVLKRHMSLMKSEESQVFAVKMGLVAEAMIGRVHAANRYADVYGVGPSAKVAEGVMRASLLSPWTDAGRKAFGMEFSSTLAENFGKTIGELDPNLQRAFKEYGIDEADWNTFRKSKTLSYQKAQFADLTQPGGKKFHQMIMSETDFAVPTPDAKVRAVMNGGLGRATIEGQAWRSAMMLKSFPATIIMTHFYRAAYQATTADKLKYIAAITATTTILGGVALQMKDVSAGRDPREIDAQFFAAAMQQGGGFGILGDFMFSNTNRFGAGLTETLTGPTGELFDSVVKFTHGNILEAVKGEETNILGEAVQLLDRYTPDVWQTYLFSNAVFDQLEMMADPDAAKKFNRQIRKRRTEYDQDYWWKPGELTPDRAPDIESLSGG
jgi:hypothetical protein